MLEHNNLSVLIEETVKRTVAGLAARPEVFVTPEWLTPAQAAVYSGFAEKTLEGWRIANTGPRYYRVGGRVIRYRRDDLDAFIQASPVQPGE